MEKQEHNKRLGFVITKNTKHVSDSGVDEVRDVSIPKAFDREFRLADDDGNIYFYGFQDVNFFEEFNPLDFYGNAYGCVDLHYKDNEAGVNGKWRCL